MKIRKWLKTYYFKIIARKDVFFIQECQKKLTKRAIYRWRFNG